jgi:hypothetical protein
MLNSSTRSNRRIEVAVISQPHLIRSAANIRAGLPRAAGFAPIELHDGAAL